MFFQNEDKTGEFPILQCYKQKRVFHLRFSPIEWKLMRCETPHRPYCSFSFLFCTQYWWPEGYFCNLPPIVYTANLLFRPCSDNMCSSFTAFIKWERHRTNQIVSDRCLFVRAVFCCILSVFATSYTKIIRQSLCCVANTTNQCLTRYSRVLAVYIHTGSLDDWFWLAAQIRSDFFFFCWTNTSPNKSPSWTDLHVQRSICNIQDAHMCSQWLKLSHMVA